MLELLFILLGTVLIATSLRIVAIYIHKEVFNQGFFGDSSIHFMIIKQLKKDFSSKYIEQYLISPEPMSYPTGFHRFSLIFSLNLIRKHPYIPNLIIFILGSIIFIGYIHYIEVKYFSIDDYMLVLYSAIFYFTLVTNWYYHGPSIAYMKLSERLLGRIGSSFFFLFSYFSIFYQDTYSFFLASLAGGIVLISSIFSRQVIIFIVMIQTILFLSFKPLFILIFAFVIALLLSREHFIRAMKHTVLTWKLYKTHTKKSKLVLRGLSGFFSFQGLKNKSIFGIVKYLVNKEPFHVMLFLADILLLFILLLQSEQGFENNIWFYIGSVYIVYFLTSLESLNHLGEAYRYPEYSLYFLSPLLISIVLIQNDIPLVNMWTSIYFLFVFILWVAYFIYLKKLKFPSEDLLTSFLNKIDIPSDSVIYPISMRLGGDICSRGEYKSFWWQPGIISTGIYDKYIQEYPFLKHDWKDLFMEYNVDYVMADKKALELNNLSCMDWKYDFSKLELINEDENYILYGVNS